MLQIMEILHLFKTGPHLKLPLTPGGSRSSIRWWNIIVPVFGKYIRHFSNFAVFPISPNYRWRSNTWSKRSFSLRNVLYFCMLFKWIKVHFNNSINWPEPHNLNPKGFKRCSIVLSRIQYLQIYMYLRCWGQMIVKIRFFYVNITKNNNIVI